MPHSIRRLTTSRRYTAGVVLVAGLVAVEPSAAQQVRVGRSVVVGADEVITDDLYAFGDTVVIEGTVTGDLMASGRVVSVSGAVNGDVFGCGQRYVVDGRVGDDLRIAGMSVVLGPDARVGDDVASAAGRFETRVGSTIVGSLMFVGHRAWLAGDILGDLGAEASAVELAGSIGGTVDVGVDERTAAAGSWRAGRPIAVVMVAGLLMAWLTPSTFRNLEARVRTRPLGAVGRGAIGTAALLAGVVGVALVAIGVGAAAARLGLWSLMPAVGLAAAATGVALATFLMLAVLVGPAMVGVVVGRSILSRLSPDRAVGIIFPLLTGLCLLGVVLSVPYLGLLVRVLVGLVGIGTVWSHGVVTTVNRGS